MDGTAKPEGLISDKEIMKNIPKPTKKEIKYRKDRKRKNKLSAQSKRRNRNRK